MCPAPTIIGTFSISRSKGKDEQANFLVFHCRIRGNDCYGQSVPYPSNSKSFCDRCDKTPQTGPRRQRFLDVQLGIIIAF
jgi:hypothetical protein